MQGIDGGMGIVWCHGSMRHRDEEILLRGLG